MAGSWMQVILPERDMNISWKAVFCAMMLTLKSGSEILQRFLFLPMQMGMDTTEMGRSTEEWRREPLILRESA